MYFLNSQLFDAPPWHDLELILEVLKYLQPFTQRMSLRRYIWLTLLEIIFLWSDEVCEKIYFIFLFKLCRTRLEIDVQMTGQMFLQAVFFSCLTKFLGSCIISLLQNWKHPWIILYSACYSSWWVYSSELCALERKILVWSVYLISEGKIWSEYVVTWDLLCKLRSLCIRHFKLLA